VPDDPTTDPSAPQSWWQKYGPAIGQAGAQGAGLIGGIYASRAAQNAALQRSPEELAALKGATGAAGSLGQTGTSMLNEAQPYIAQPASYYQTLLRGSRGAMANAVAPARAALQESYRGEQAKLANSGIRGAARDQLQGNLDRQQAGQVSALTTGVQPGAASALAGVGGQLQQTAAPLLGQAGNIYQQLLSQGAANRTQAMKEGTDTGQSAGKLIADLGTTLFGGGKKTAGTTTPPKGKTPATATGGAPPAPPYQVPPYQQNGPEFPDEEQPPVSGGGDWRPSDTNGWDDPSTWT
jgi:hypothetical protein